MIIKVFSMNALRKQLVMNMNTMNGKACSVDEDPAILL